MTFTQFVAAINGWLNKAYDVDLITSWIRMMEERISGELRVAEMIDIDRAVITESRIEVPNDWLETDFVAIVDKHPLYYMGRDEFYSRPISERSKHYTMLGRSIVIGGSYSSSFTVEMSYYAYLPQFVDQPTWLISLYPRLAISATLSMASTYGIEDPRFEMWENETSERITILNMKHKQSKASGSLLIAKLRGFG